VEDCEDSAATFEAILMHIQNPAVSAVIGLVHAHCPAMADFGLGCW
jgi:hypothetical protein